MSSPRHRSTFLASLALAAAVSLATGLWPASATPGGGDSSCADRLGVATSPPAAVLSGEFRVLSWNLQKASQVNWAEDLAAVGADVELAFLQEATTSAPIEETLPGQLSTAFAPGYRGSDLQTGVLTLSKVPAMMECDLQAMEPWLGTPKATAVTEFALPGGRERLLAINTHSVNFALGLEDYSAQLAQLDRLLRQHTGPVVIAGDFNTWRSARLQLLEKLMGEHGLTGIGFEPDLRSTFMGQPLDHIFIRGLEADAARAVPVDTSDHNPLLVTLRLP